MNKKEEIIFEKKEVKISFEQLNKGLKDYILCRKLNCNSKETITNVSGIINRFISFCRKYNETYITEKEIHCYVTNLRGKQKSTIDKYLKNLKLFFRYLFEQNLVDINFEKIIPKTKYLSKSKIPFYWDEENINKLLNVIDCSSNIGKRDYAILIILIRLGLRSRDIINLKLDDIDWNKNQIKFYQHKTSQIQCLPLLTDVGNAILDYITNIRKKSLNTNTRILFLDNNNLNPFRNAQNVSRILYKYEKKANISIDKSFKNGAHSFRNTLAYNLLLNEQPLDTISQVLGHVNPNTARIYLKIDLNKLKECILDWRNIK